LYFILGGFVNGVTPVSEAEPATEAETSTAAETRGAATGDAITALAETSTGHGAFPEGSSSISCWHIHTPPLNC
jgi:hypothetical protein